MKSAERISTLLMIGFVASAVGENVNNTDSVVLPLFKNNPLIKNAMQGFYSRRSTPCTCGIFMEGQLLDANTVMPDASAAFVKEMEISMLPCGMQGNKLCTNKCLNMVIHHMPVAGPLICASIDRDCFREKAYLFIKNCDNSWRPTGFSPGKEFCCIGGMETRCMKNIRAAQEPKPFSIISSLLDSRGSDSRSIPIILLDFANRAAGVASEILGVRHKK